MTTPSLLTLTYSGQDMKTYTEACSIQIYFVSLQKQLDNTTVFVSYWSRFLADREMQHETTLHKCLVTVWAFLFLPLNLEGHRVTIRTDHDAQKLILYMTDSESRLSQCFYWFSEFDVKVVQSAGLKHLAADTLSWLDNRGKDTSIHEDDIPLVANDTHTSRDTATNNKKVVSPQWFEPLTITEFYAHQRPTTTVAYDLPTLTITTLKSTSIPTIIFSKDPASMKYYSFCFQHPFISASSCNRIIHQSQDTPANDECTIGYKLSFTRLTWLQI